MEKLLLIPLDDTVVFPNMSATLPLDVGGESRVLLVPRHEGEYASVGTVAEVTEIGRLPGGASVATLEGLHRAVIGAAETGPDGRLYVDVEERPDDTPPPVKTRELGDRVPRRGRRDSRAPECRRADRRVLALRERARARSRTRARTRPT